MNPVRIGRWIGWAALPFAAVACGPPAGEEEVEVEAPACLDVVLLELHPTDSAIEVGVDRGAEVHFRATGATGSGETYELRPDWWISPPDAGDLGGGGAFVPSGLVAGPIRVAARHRGSVAETKLLLSAWWSLPVDVPRSARALFNESRPRHRGSRAPRLLFPADGASAPTGEPLELRWTARDGGWARAALLGAHATVVVFERGDRHELAPDLLGRLAQAQPGRPFRLLVEWAETDREEVWWDERSIELRLCLPAERCDGADDDCDRLIDEDCLPPLPPFFDGAKAEDGGGCDAAG